jgi:hypothetical protein
MAKSTNALKSVVVWLNDIFKIVADQLQDIEAKKEILIALGLDPAGATSSPNLPAGSLASIQQYVDKSDDDIDIEAFVSVVADIISVSNAIDDFIHVVTDTDDPDIVTQFLDMLLQLYLMEAARLRSTTKDAKALYLVSKILNFYQEIAEPSGGISNFTGNIAGFLKRIFQSINAENDDEAALISDTICVVLAALSYVFPFVRDNLKVVFGFDPAPGSTSPNADLISERTITLSLSYRIDDPEGNEITAKLIVSAAVRPQNQQGGGIEVLLGGGGKFERKFGEWKFSLSMDGVEGVDLRTKIKIEHDGEQSPLVIGDTKGTNLTIGGASFELNASIADNDLDVKLDTKDSAFVLAKGKTDGFLNSILPEQGIHGSFDFGIGYSLRKGVYVDGGSGLTVLIPLHTTLGPVILNSFYLKLAGNNNKDGVLVETSIGLSTRFLGFSASVERIGLLHNFSLPADGKKNLGFVNYAIDFKPPNGVGLSLDAGVLKGGGFLYLDPDKGEYFGALELSFKELFTLKAVGVINTKMPDGSPGFSMLVIITAEFPPIQLGFGFTLIGVGGLLGLNRTARLEVLREGIKTNSLNSILFPQDVVANMSRIISDITQVFPPLKDRFLVGPMGEFGWGTPTILSLELGIVLEIPAPRIAILGILRALLPEESQPLLRLQVNFMGVIDFENKYISFDASLYDSRLLTFTLTGDMAFRLSWGDHSVLILSVGGFHPAFKEAPGDLQNMTRLTLSLLSGENPRIVIQCYFAVTSNTVQFGAKAELYAAAAGFNIYGFIGFDLLFQFDPFKFIADFAAGLALRRGTSVIMGIRVSGELSGTNPWDAKGEGSISLLFFDITVGFHETWGDPLTAVEEEAEDLIQRLTGEVGDNRNWKADTPDNNSLHVSLKALQQPPDKLVIHPFGILTFSQRLVPLELTIDKFGNKRPKDANRFEVKPADAGLAADDATEQFAPANFFSMSDSDKLSRPSFEQMKSGFKITGSSTLIVPATVNKSVDYELTYLRKSRGLRIIGGVYKYMKVLFRANLRAGAISKCTLSFTNKRISTNSPDQIAPHEDGYVVATTSDLKQYGESAAASSYTEAAQHLDELVRNDPSLKGKVQVVLEHELNLN